MNLEVTKAGRSAFRGRRTMRSAAFTLIEVMVALLLFFMAIFTVLSLLANSLKQARLLQKKTTDCGPLATLMTMTNRLYDGAIPSEVIEQFEEMYPDYSADGECIQITNGLWEVRLVVLDRRGGKGPEADMTIYLYDQNSAQGSLTPGPRR